MRRKAASIFGIGPRAICAPKTNFFDRLGVPARAGAAFTITILPTRKSSAWRRFRVRRVLHGGRGARGRRGKSLDRRKGHGRSPRSLSGTRTFRVRELTRVTSSSGQAHAYLRTCVPACNFRRPRRKAVFGGTPNSIARTRMLPTDILDPMAGFVLRNCAVTPTGATSISLGHVRDRGCESKSALKARFKSKLIAPDFDCFLHPGREPVGHDHPSARVPTKKRVVVVRRAEGLSLFKPFHCLVQILVGIMAGTGMALEQPCLGLSLADYARVISALIGILET